MESVVITAYDWDNIERQIRVYTKDFDTDELGGRTFEEILKYIEDNGLQYEIL